MTVQYQYPYDVVLPVTPTTSCSSPQDVAQKWIDDFGNIIARGNLALLDTVFHEECWWRDVLALSWDMRTLHGVAEITTFLIETQKDKESCVRFGSMKLKETGSFTPSQTTITESLNWIESMFSFKTKLGHGQGVLRLTTDKAGNWKAYTFYTSLQELKDHEWITGSKRPYGANNALDGGIIEGNWFERREKERKFLDKEPSCLIIGAGQSGLNIAARLQALGLSCLVVDRNKRIGDNWRNRYRTLVTHDPVHMCHMAYLPFPTTWPFFTPKDKLADWFESYAELVDLNVWMDTNIESSTWLDTDSIWTISLKKGVAKSRTLHPRHVIFSTGHAGEPQIPSFPNQETFEGIIYHGSQHKDASSNGDAKGKNVVVVGTGNSGHDIAQNFYDNGANVTMLQRSSTHVVTAAVGLPIMTEALYGENSPATEDADLYAQSFPIPVGLALARLTTAAIMNADSEILEGLSKAGFRLNNGVNGSGLMSLYYTKGGGYYIDTGCSQLIIDGKIKIEQSPNGIGGFDKEALILADGRKLQADIVVLATGYDNMRTSLQKALGKEVASRSKDVWGLDDEAELKTMWRSSGHPGLWYMGGNLSLCRQYSKFLALQIKAEEVGLKK